MNRGINYQLINYRGIIATDVAGGTLHLKLQLSQKEWYWFTWKEMMAGQGISITTRVVRAYGFALFYS